MKLYLLTIDCIGYDAWDEAVVVARSPKHARTIHPGDTPEKKYVENPRFPSWATDPAEIAVKYLGVAASTLREGEVVCASFNAG